MSWRNRMSGRDQRWCRDRWPPRSCLRSRLFRRALGFRRAFRVGYTLQMMLNFFRYIGRNRAGMRFLFGNAKTGQKVNDGFRLDLEFARELIDADLICVAHAS
jgi:hypothetical protein